jgi:hypothetical protein
LCPLGKEEREGEPQRIKGCREDFGVMSL